MKRTALAVAIAAICAGMSLGVSAEQESPTTSNEQQETSGAGAQGAQGAQSQTSTEDDTDASDVQSGDTDTDTDMESETDTDSDTDMGTAAESDAQTDSGTGSASGADNDSMGQMSGDQGGDMDADTDAAEEADTESDGQMASQPSINSDDATADDAMPAGESMTEEAANDSDGQMEGNQNRSPNAMEDPDHLDPDETLAENDTQGGLMSLTISDVVGMTVVNQQGDDIGDVDRVVEHNDSGDLYAIVAIGGFWGFGATDVALALQEITLEEDQLVMQTTYGSDEIETATEEYNEDNYTRIDGSMQVGEVANHPTRGE